MRAATVAVLSLLLELPPLASAAEKEAAPAASYAHSGLHERARLREHCEKVSSAHQALATEYEALAAAHEAEAESRGEQVSERLA